MAYLGDVLKCGDTCGAIRLAAYFLFAEQDSLPFRQNGYSVGLSVVQNSQEILIFFTTGTYLRP